MFNHRMRLIRLSFSILVGAAIGLGAAVPATASTFSTIYPFGSASQPNAGLVMDSAGNLYGTTQIGGVNSGGSVFMLTPNAGHTAWTQTTLFSFCPSSSCTDGSADTQGYYPVAPLIIDINGNLYGTTNRGGPAHTGAYNGTAFKLVHPSGGGSWTLNVIHGFCSPSNGCTASGHDGYNVVAGLTYAGAASGAPYNGTSALYGTTVSGGSQNAGTVFRLKPVTSPWAEAILFDFCPTGCFAVGSAGGNPEAGVTVDASGDLYGTAGDGNQGGGTVYKLTHSSSVPWPASLLYTFCSTRSGGQCYDGESPAANVFLDANGNIFGTTGGGGSYAYYSAGGGVVFELANAAISGTCTYGTITEWCITDLHQFCMADINCSDGRQPSRGLALAQDSVGHLFGTTESGGAGGEGLIYKLGGGSLTTFHDLYDFCTSSGCPDGELPFGGLIWDTSGNLYGTTSQGGTVPQYGTVFEFTP